MESLRIRRLPYKYNLDIPAGTCPFNIFFPFRHDKASNTRA